MSPQEAAKRYQDAKKINYKPDRNYEIAAREFRGISSDVRDALVNKWENDYNKLMKRK